MRVIARKRRSRRSVDGINVSSTISRRDLLAGIATGSAGLAAFEGLTWPATVRAATVEGPGTGDNSRGQRPGAVWARSAPDGLPVGSVAGTYVGSAGGFILVAVEAPVGIVRVRILATTEIIAGGRFRYGDTSSCVVGDRIFTGTTVDANGNRSAEFAFTNGRAYWADVQSVDADGVTLSPDWPPGWVGPSTLRLTTIAETTVYPRGGMPPATGQGSAQTVLRAGDSYIHATCIGATPDIAPDVNWAITIHQ